MPSKRQLSHMKKISKLAKQKKILAKNDILREDISVIFKDKLFIYL